jgi:hypothetical protein
LTAWLQLFGQTLTLVMTLNRDTLWIGLAVRRDVTSQVPCAEGGADLKVRRGHEPAIRRRRPLLAPFEVDWVDERVLLPVFFVPLERAEPRFEPRFEPRLV